MGMCDSGGGSSGNSQTTSVPWSEAQPYLTGAGGQTGVFPEAASVYNSSKWTPAMQSNNDAWIQSLYARQANPAFKELANGAAQAFGAPGQGLFDAQITPSKNIGVGKISPKNVDMVSARKAQGSLDPSRSLSQLLSGTPNNPWLDKQAAAITGQMTRNLQQKVLPGIDNEAFAAGGYGGSRQGIAQGLAESQMAQDLAPALTNLYGSAYESAQNRMDQTANGLNQQAVQVATDNSNRDYNAQAANVSNQMAADQFNANLGLQNNTQAMQNMQNMVGTRVNALNFMNNAYNSDNQNYQQAQFALQQPSLWANDMLKNYAGIISPGAGLGGTTYQPYYNNTLGQVAGAASTGLGIYSALSGMGKGG